MAYSPASLLNPVDYGASSIGAPILYVVRHAENDDDAENKIRGLKDQPINEKGEKQLAGLRSFFANRPVSAVVTDDLSRTRSTAMAIAQVCGCGVDTDIDLRSWDLGKLEGLSIERHKMEIQDFKTHPDKVPVGGQSWGDFKRQALDSAQRWVQRAMAISGPIAIVTHGSWIAEFFVVYGGTEPNAAYETPLDQAGVVALYIGRNGYELKILKGLKPVLDE